MARPNASIMSRTAYSFAGWEFWQVEQDGKAMLILEKELLNPHPPNAILSYKCFQQGTDPREAAAWLIAHWYEHALDICPCQHGEEGNARSIRFRHYCMDSLLALNP